MSEQIGSVYRIRGDNPLDWVGEANRIFELLSVRLDKLEGYRGNGTFYNYVECKSDVVVSDTTKGIVLRDNGNPANYWRVTVSSVGGLVVTNLGRVYP